MTRLRRWAAPLLLLLLLFAFSTALVAAECDDDCAPGCSDCSLCSVAALPSTAVSTSAAAQRPARFENLDPSARTSVRRAVGHVPLSS